MVSLVTIELSSEKHCKNTEAAHLRRKGLLINGTANYSSPTGLALATNKATGQSTCTVRLYQNFSIIYYILILLFITRDVSY